MTAPNRDIFPGDRVRLLDDLSLFAFPLAIKAGVPGIIRRVENNLAAVIFPINTFPGGCALSFWVSISNLEKIE